jgi:hypothetical protein
MVVVALTFRRLVVDLSGITGNTGLLYQTAVGKVNGRSIDARTYQSVVQQSVTPAGRRRARSASRTIAQIRDGPGDIRPNTVLTLSTTGAASR